MYNNHIPHYDVTQKTTLNKLLHWTKLHHYDYSCSFLIFVTVTITIASWYYSISACLAIIVILIFADNLFLYRFWFSKQESHPSALRKTFSCNKENILNEIYKPSQKLPKEEFLSEKYLFLEKVLFKNILTV